MGIKIIRYSLCRLRRIKQEVTNIIAGIEIVPLIGFTDCRIDQVTHLAVSRKIFIDRPNRILTVVFRLNCFFGMNGFSYSGLFTKHFESHTFRQDYFFRVFQTIPFSFNNLKIKYPGNSRMASLYQLPITNLLSVFHHRKIDFRIIRIDQTTGFDMGR